MGGRSVLGQEIHFRPVWEQDLGSHGLCLLPSMTARVWNNTKFICSSFPAQPGPPVPAGPVPTGPVPSWLAVCVPPVPLPWNNQSNAGLSPLLSEMVLALVPKVCPM